MLAQYSRRDMIMCLTSGKTNTTVRNYRSTPSIVRRKLLNIMNTTEDHVVENITTTQLFDNDTSATESTVGRDNMSTTVVVDDNYEDLNDTITTDYIMENITTIQQFDEADFATKSTVNPTLNITNVTTTTVVADDDDERVSESLNDGTEHVVENITTIQQLDTVEAEFVTESTASRDNMTTAPNITTTIVVDDDGEFSKTITTTTVIADDKDLSNELNAAINHINCCNMTMFTTNCSSNSIGNDTNNGTSTQLAGTNTTHIQLICFIVSAFFFGLFIGYVTNVFENMKKNKKRMKMNNKRNNKQTNLQLSTHGLTMKRSSSATTL